MTIEDVRAAAAFAADHLAAEESGKTAARTMLPQDITAATSDGKSLFVGLADGRLFRSS